MFKQLVILTISSLLGGCATSSIFNPYPAQAEEFKQAIGSGSAANSRGDKVLEALEDKRDSPDKMLYLMERGRITQLDGKYDDSRADFSSVIDEFERQNLEATIQASRIASQGASLISNDNAIPYKGAGYERVFTHHFQAFNYLGDKDLEGAGVEFRKVALEQRVLQEKYDSELSEAYQEAGQNNIDIDALSQEFSGLNAAVGKVKSSFQNAYTFYTSAAFWEATREYNAALVDYKKALEINPDSTLIRQDIARVSKKLGDDFNDSDLNDIVDGQGTVVVLFEDGFVPVKSEIKIPIPTFDGGLISIAFPFYDAPQFETNSTLSIVSDDSGLSLNTEVVVDVGALAAKNLKEQIPQLLVRQVVRGYAKYEFQKQASRQGDWAQLFASLYNIVSESADRRSWLTLPSTGQVARVNLNEGPQSIRLQARGAILDVELHVIAGRTQFLRVVQANGQLITQIFLL